MSDVYITGDTHGNFNRIFDFCKRYGTTAEDILIILGDAGINFWQDSRDNWLKNKLSKTPITIFAIHGNHDVRPYDISTYKEIIWHNGIVYVEEKYPNILFAKDGEVYSIANKSVIAIGGAYSIDKDFRIKNNWPWFSNEQPNDEIKKRVEDKLRFLNNKVDIVLTHTIPLKYEPVEMFMKDVDQSKVDKSTEIWLDKIENTINYSKWYCGHYHTNKYINKKVRILFEDILMF